VPHCNGLGYRDPSALAAMRGVKAEGGWAVVCTEQAEIHPSSDITPFIELRLWDDRDIPALARMAEAIHAHGSLAGIELAYNGMNGPNHYGREVPMGPAHLPVATFAHEPLQARRMNKADIENLRRWHLNAVRRGPRSPIRFCRRRSKRGASRTFANASAAIFASRVILPSRRFAARRIRPWPKNGAKAGIPNGFGREVPSARY
jgi:hypothetical protein